MWRKPAKKPNLLQRIKNSWLKNSANMNSTIVDNNNGISSKDIITFLLVAGTIGGVVLWSKQQESKDKK